MTENGENSHVVNTNDSGGLDKYYQERLPDLVGVLKRKPSCRLSSLTSRIPILTWLSNYQGIFLLQDFIAGLTVGLTAIPQGIAYAVVAGLSPQYGLYSAFMGSFVYILFGSCKDITIGPTAIMALMVRDYVSYSPDFAILACFLAGCVIALFGLLHLGFLVGFISEPVTNGFTTAAAITIASGQINALLGIPSSGSNDFVSSWRNLFTKITEFRIWDTTPGITTLICLLILRKSNTLTGKWKLFGKYLGLSRNALAVIIGVAIAYTFSRYDLNPFRLTGQLQSGLPPFRLPPFSTIVNNGTQLNFSDMIGALGSSLIAIPLISILDTIAIANSFSKGKTVDASQEMIALGLCNMAGAFFSSMPITGSFTRTAVNSASGVMTPLGGLFTGVLVLLGLGLLTETFYFIPKTVLAAIILSAMIFMIHYEKVVEIWRSKRMDILPYLVTVLACLFFGLEIGIVSGIALSIAFILYETARPDIYISHEKYNTYEVVFAKPTQNLIFPSVGFLKNQIIEQILNMQSESKYLIIDGDLIKSIDSTVALNLQSLCADLKLLNCDVIFWNWRKETAGVLWRLSKSFEKLFQSGLDYREFVKGRYRKPSDKTEEDDIFLDK